MIWSQENCKINVDYYSIWWYINRETFAFSCKRIIHPKHNAKYVLSIHHAVYINTPNKRELPYIPYNQAADINLKEVIKIHKLTVIDPCLFSVTDTTYIMVMEGNIEILDTNHDAEKT